MNCKPGDLAIVIRDCDGHHQGKIVTVVDGACRPSHWLTDPKLIDPSGLLVEAHDSDLRPIRDPGDDAVDETLLWLPLPTKEHA